MQTCGVIFDLDGVVTRTAAVHARAWKDTFDPFLRRFAGRSRMAPDQAARPFDAAEDYLRHVDGKPRSAGVRDFLASRGFRVPDTDDGDGYSVEAVGRAKNERFLTLVRERGVDVYPSTLALIDHLRAQGIRRAVVSSSRNCRYILEQVGLSDRFDATVDGHDSAVLGLAGKPAPDIYLKGAELIGCAPSDSIVVEDAVSGVEAARRGRFAVVIGIDRGGNATALRLAGADPVIGDFAELEIGALDRIA